MGIHHSAPSVRQYFNMRGSQHVFLGCWVSVDEQDQLCEVSLDKSAFKEVSIPSEQQIDSIFQALRYPRVEVRHEGDAPSGPIIILDDVVSDTITPDVDAPPQTPEQPEKRPQSSQEIDSISNDLDQNATAQDPSSPEGVLSTPESVMPEEHSPQLNNNIAIVHSRLPVSSPAGTIEENPQHIEPKG